jgi:CrcB protein
MNLVVSSLVIGLGSALGGLARYLCGLLAVALVGASFPWGTIAINLIGSFVIGAFNTLTGPDGRLYVRPLGRQFVMVGLCGGYTTFSSFSLETLALLQQGRPFAAGANIALSLVLCLLAVWLGHGLARKLNECAKDAPLCR